MLKPKDKEAMLRFLKDWAKPMQSIFDERFGKNRIGHIIIATDTGNDPSVNYVTNLRDADFKRLLRMLADYVNERKIIYPN